MRPFSLLYFFFLWIFYLFSIPLLLVLLKKEKYKESIPKRFFLRDNKKAPNGDIWFHACSYGEVKSLKPILKELHGKKILITSTTQTGYKEALALGCEARYLPFDIFIPFWASKYKTLVVTEAEFWYGLFYVFKRNGGNVILINSRISDRSFNGYYKFRWFYKKVFGFVDHIFAQQEKDKERLELLGASNITVSGNIKLLHRQRVSKTYQKPNTLVITGASTHDGEEEIILEAFLKENNGKLIIAPRHPDRFANVYESLKERIKGKHLTIARFSEDNSFSSDITIVDMMGELINIYAISDIVILGGGFAKVGGHNPIEPAFFGCRIISGIHIYNQFALFEMIENYILCNESELFDAIQKAKISKASYIKGEFDMKKIIEKITQ